MVVIPIRGRRLGYRPRANWLCIIGCGADRRQGTPNFKMDNIDTLQFEMAQATGDVYAEQVTYNIWASIAITTKAFKKIDMKIDPKSQRIFAAISLAWWASFKRFERIRNFWLKKAEKAAEEYKPNGWKLLIYYRRKK